MLLGPTKSGRSLLVKKWITFFTVKKCFLTLRGHFLVLFFSLEFFGQKQKLSLDNFRQFCFWAHQNLDAPRGSKSGLLSLDWCDGEGGAGEGKLFVIV